MRRLNVSIRQLIRAVVSVVVLACALIGAGSPAGAAEAIMGAVRYSDGRPAAGAVVYALDGRRPFRVRNNILMSGEGYPRALTGRDGAFSLDVGPESVALLAAQDMNDAWGVARPGGATLITINSPAQGEVRIFNGETPAPGENVLVSYTDPAAKLLMTYAGRSGREGGFRLPALMPGAYEVSTWQDVPQVGCCFRSVTTRKTTAEVAPGSRPIIQLGGTGQPALSGRISDTDGNPLHGVWVRLLPRHGNDDVVHSAVTEQDGAYTIYDVPPGPYEVRCFRRLALNSSSRTLEAKKNFDVSAKAPEATCDIAIDLEDFRPLTPGQPAPALEGRSLDDAPFQYAGFQGRYTVLHFYAAWCSGCVKTIGWFDEHADKLTGVQIIGVSLDEDLDTAQQFATSSKLNHPVVYAGSWGENSIRKAYRVTNIPTSVIIGPDGTVVHVDLFGQVLLDYLKDRQAI